ncbi:MAG: hypothetical protein HYU99_02680, partial [Deltaproteobacteria bacterium]|nr:hypothetical protein [Deltaproteobacteria bacterium]
MILTLQEELSRLYAAYVRNGGEDPDALSRWPDLNDRSAEAQKLTVDDWRVLHHVFLSVAAAGGEVFENWFVRLSRRFGAADHAVTRTSRKNGLPDNEEAVADEHGVDMWAYDMLLGAAWLVTGASPSGPADLLPEGAARYLTLPPELRTHFTDEMLVVEQLLGAITTLSPEKMDDRTREFLRNGNDEIFFKRVYIDQRDLLLEHDTHWMLLYNAVLNSLWQSELPVHLFRAHLNMTTINEMDSDPKRRHGDLYLGVAKGLLKGHFSRVVQNPERTTFSFMAHSAEDVRDRLTDFDHDISHRLVTSPGVNPEVVTRFTPQVVVSERVISRDNLYEYAIAGEDDLDAFRGVIEFEGDLSVDDLKATVKARGIEVAMEILKKQVPPFSLIRDKGDSVSRKTLDALILQALIRANGLLAAQTSFFERYPAGADNAPLSGGAFSSHAVYQEKQLPQPGDLLYGQWMEMRFKLTGFVGTGEYQPSGNSRLMSLPGPEIPSFQMGDADFPGFSGEGLHPRVGHLLRRIPRIGRW